MNNKIQIFKNEKLNQSLRTILNDNGDISINLEDATYGLGMIKIDRKNGKEYTRANIQGVKKHLKSFGIDSSELTKEDYIPESAVYLLAMKADNKVAQEFQKWLAVDVIPQIRKTGSYTNNQNSINEFKGQLTTLVNDLFEDKLSDIKEYYKIKSKSKSDISSYIKKRLGILRADDEYEQVKARVFLILGISKWEDLNVDNYKEVLPVIDESIRIIKLDRPQQIGMWD